MFLRASYSSLKFPRLMDERLLDGADVLDVVVNSKEILLQPAHLMLAVFSANLAERVVYLSVIECDKFIKQGLVTLLWQYYATSLINRIDQAWRF